MFPFNTLNFLLSSETIISMILHDIQLFNTSENKGAKMYLAPQFLDGNWNKIDHPKGSSQESTPFIWVLPIRFLPFSSSANIEPISTVIPLKPHLWTWLMQQAIKWSASGRHFRLVLQYGIINLMLCREENIFLVLETYFVVKQ